MPENDIFALERSGFKGFLFACIGTEANGSSLSVLSTLARLGHDPWGTAASWAAMSQAGAAEALATCIAKMPLLPADHVAAPNTAAHLVRLLSSAAVAHPPQHRAGSSALRPATPLLTLLSAIACAGILAGCAFMVAQRTAVPQAQATSTEPAGPLGR